MTLFRATAVMATGTALSRATGLIRVLAMTFALGVSGTRLADTYAIANTLPNQIYEIFLGGIFTSVFVPVLLDLKANKKSNSALLGTSLTVVAGLSILVGIFASAILAIYPLRIADPLLAAQARALAADLLVLFAPQVFLYGLCAIGEALLTSNKRFAAPKFLPIVNNLFVSAMFLTYASFIGEQGLSLSPRAKLWLGLGTTLGVAIQAAGIVAFAAKGNLRLRFSITDPAVKTVLRLSGYVVGYVAINQVGLLAVISLASSVPGAIVAYQIAFVFIQLPHGLFSVSVNSALITDLSESHRTNDTDRYASLAVTGLRTIAFLTLPAAAGYLALSEPMTQLLLVRGQTTISDARLVASVIAAFATGLIFFSWFQFARTCFHARRDTKTPTIINAVSVAAHVAFMFPLFRAYGVRGIAFGWAISYMLATVLAIVSINKRVPIGARIADSALDLSKMAIGAVIAAIVARLALSTSEVLLISIPLSALAGAVSYFAIAYALRIPEAKLISLRH